MSHLPIEPLPLRLSVEAPVSAVPHARDTDGIRSVARALDVLKLLNQEPSMSLGELHRRTKLPKPTVHRLLSTLKAIGYVCAEGDGGVYRVTEKVRELGGGYTERSLVVDAGSPIARRVTREIRWPLAIGTLNHTMMVVRYSTMPYSPLAVQATTVGHHLSLIESAMGMAYLAACSDIEREALLSALFEFDPLRGPTCESIAHEIAVAKRRGYGLRLPHRRGTSATVAVPILLGSTVLGVLSMTTFGASMNSRLLAQHAPILKATSEEIAAAVHERMSQDPGTSP